MKITEKMLDILYPPRCALCHGILVSKGMLVCEGCEKKAEPVQEPRCKKCGKPLQYENQEYCGDCIRRKADYDQGIGIFPYDDVMQKSMAYLKYHGRAEYAKYFGYMMWKYGKSYIRHWKIQYIVPIPVHYGRLCRRGYNQAGLLAAELGNHTGLPVMEKLLYRKRMTMAQKNLDPLQRRKNLNHAFYTPEKIPYRTILLVDDIFTTGSTVDAAARQLKRAGAEKVYFITACIGNGNKM